MGANDIIEDIVGRVRRARNGERRPPAMAPDPVCVLEERQLRVIFPVAPKREANKDDERIARWTSMDEELRAELSITTCADVYEALERLEQDHAWELRQRGHEIVADTHDALGAAPGRAITTVRDGVVLQFREFARGRELVRVTAAHTDADAKAARFLRSLAWTDEAEELRGGPFDLTFPALSRASVEGDFYVQRAETSDGVFVLEYFDAPSSKDARASMIEEADLAKAPGFLTLNSTATASSVFRRHDHEIVLDRSSVVAREYLVRRRLYRLYASAPTATATQFLDSFRLRDAAHVVITPLQSFGFPSPPRVERSANEIHHRIETPDGSFRVAQTPAAKDPEVTLQLHLNALAKREGLEGSFNVVPSPFGRDSDFSFAHLTDRKAIHGRCFVRDGRSLIAEAVTTSDPVGVGLGSAFISGAGMGSVPVVSTKDGHFVVATRWYQVQFPREPSRTVHTDGFIFGISSEKFSCYLTHHVTDASLDDFVERWRFDYIASGGVVLSTRQGVESSYPFREVCVAPSYDGKRQAIRFVGVFGAVVMLTALGELDAALQFIRSLTT